MANKAYDPKLKEKFDGVGKALTQEILANVFGAVLVANNIHEDSGDFSKGFWDQKYVLKDGREILVEPEIKDCKWFGENFAHLGRPFQYDTVDIPFRKAKNKATLFLVISSCGQFAFLVNRKAMDQSLEDSGGPKFKRTKWERAGAHYYSVPMTKGFFVKKTDGIWSRWKAPENV